MSGRKGQLHYRIETKQEAIRLVEEEHLTYAEVARRLEIRKAKRIMAWVRAYRQSGEASLHKPIGRPLQGESEQRELERLRMENALLKKFHGQRTTTFPNCGKCSSRSAISGDLPLQRRIRGESDV